MAWEENVLSISAKRYGSICRVVTFEGEECPGGKCPFPELQPIRFGRSKVGKMMMAQRLKHLLTVCC